MGLNELDKSRRQLIAGVQQFQRDVYPRLRVMYQQLVREGQKPHALFITCADSRIDPELITQSGPGEIFVCRNVGNIVPTYSRLSGGVSAVVEYAVAGLHVNQVVICGHTDCGAMTGLLHPEKVGQLPAVKSWLRNSSIALRMARRRTRGEDDRTVLEELIDENVLQQLDHLRTHPSVAAALADQTLVLSGWVYDIGHGTVRIYDEQQREFLSVTSDIHAASGAGRHLF
jgi:carbonic anhydrase